MFKTNYKKRTGVGHWTQDFWWYF